MIDPIIDRSPAQKQMRVDKLREELFELGYSIVPLVKASAPTVFRYRKISPEKCRELVEHYLKYGSRESAVECIKAGVSAKYAINEAACMGLRRPLWRSGNRYKDNHVDPPSAGHAKDPRWKRAIANGPVTA